jgi:hypothetical protein
MKRQVRRLSQRVSRACRCGKRWQDRALVVEVNDVASSESRSHRVAFGGASAYDHERGVRTMSWSAFWIGDFVLPAGKRPLEERAPSLDDGELEWIRYDGQMLRVRRIVDRDEADHAPLLARVKKAGGTGQLACIAWEDGPATFGIEYAVKGGEPRTLTETEIAALFEANAPAMREMLEQPAAPAAAPAGKPKPAAKKASTGAGDATKLLAATAKGSTAKRGEALEALAEVDLPAALELARAWLLDPALEPEGASWKGGKMVSKTKMRTAAARVLARDPSDANLDALVVAHRLFAGAPTAWEARAVLVAWTRPGIADRLAVEMTQTNGQAQIEALLATLVKRREVGDEALLGRFARDPEGAGVAIYGATVSFQLEILKALVAVGAPSLVDVICDVLSTPTFAQYATRYEGIFEDQPERGPAVAKAVLAAPKFPRGTLSAEVIAAIEAMAARA